MAEYIERKAMREAFENADADVVEEYEDGTCDWGFGRKNILEVINSVHAADVGPVRHGHFEPVSDDDHDEGQFYCSVCGAPEFFPNGVPLSKYCYNCGAKMDSKEETNA